MATRQFLAVFEVFRAGSLIMKGNVFLTCDTSESLTGACKTIREHGARSAGAQPQDVVITGLFQW